MRRHLIWSAVACGAIALGAWASQPSKAILEGHRVLLTLTGSGQYGWEVDALADVTGDGIDEIIVASPFRNNFAGYVDVYSGANGARLYEFPPPPGAVTFGYAVDDMGDINRDGYNDIGVGAESADGMRGHAYVYSGRNGALLWDRTGEAAGEHFGGRVSAGSDLDGDGHADILVGAEQTGIPAPNSGRVYIYSGRTGNLIRMLPAQADGEMFGSGLAVVGDVDGDRVRDVGVGAQEGGANRGGRAYVFSGATGARLRTLESPPGGTSFGFGFVSEAGDFDRNGVEDIAVGDYNGVNFAGRVAVYSGNDGSLLLSIDGDLFSGQAGLGPGRGVTDINGDGFGDLIVGQYVNFAAASNGGAVLVHGGPDGRVLQSITSDIPGGTFGYDAGPMGDIDGDGKVDLLISSAEINKVEVIAGAVAEGGALVAPVAGHSGLWFDPAHTGEGFVLEMLDAERAVVYWFTYTATGAQRYFVGIGRAVGRRLVFMDALTTSGGRLGGEFEASDVSLVPEARLVITFDGCNSGWAEYTADGVRGRQRLTRLTGIAGLDCAATGVDGSIGVSGSWFDLDAAGEGWIVQSAGSGTYVLVWFTYDDTGAQQWFIGNGTLAGRTLDFPDLARPAGGRFGRYFRPAEVQLPTWGRVTIAYADCNNAVVSWQGQAATGSSAVTRLTALRGVGCTL